MKVYTCKEFEGHYPVGAGAVVVAPDPEIAASELNRELMLKHGLRGDAKPEDMIEITTDKVAVRVLCDGNY